MEQEKYCCNLVNPDPPYLERWECQNKMKKVLRSPRVAEQEYGNETEYKEDEQR